MRSGVGKRVIDFLLALLVLFVMSGAGLLCVVAGLIWLGIYLFRHLH
jgi:hypothetical protein